MTPAPLVPVDATSGFPLCGAAAPELSKSPRGLGGVSASQGLGLCGRGGALGLLLPEGTQPRRAPPGRLLGLSCLCAPSRGGGASSPILSPTSVPGADPGPSHAAVPPSGAQRVRREQRPTEVPTVPLARPGWATAPPCLLLTQSSVGEGLPCDPPSCPHGPVTREVAGQTAAAVPRGPRLLQLRGPEACRPPHSHVWCPPGPGSRGRKGSEQPDVLWGPCPRGEGSWHWGPPRLMPSGLASRLRPPEQPPHPRLPSAPSEASQLAGHPSVREAMRVPRTGRRAGGPGLPAPWCGVAKGSLAAGPGRQQCPGVGAQAEGFSGSGPQPSLAHATVWPGALPQWPPLTKQNPAGQSLAWGSHEEQQDRGETSPGAGSGRDAARLPQRRPPWLCTRPTAQHPDCCCHPRPGRVRGSGTPWRAACTPTQVSTVLGGQWAPTSWKNFPWGAGTGLGRRKGKQGGGEWLAADLGPRLQ